MCLSLESNKGKRDQKGIINIGSENGEILQTKIIIIKIKDNKAQIQEAKNNISKMNTPSKKKKKDYEQTLELNS